MIILKLTKNLSFTLPLEDTVFEKPQEGLTPLYFLPNDSPSKTIKNVFYFSYFIEKTHYVLKIVKFCNFPLPSHTFQIQKAK